MQLRRYSLGQSILARVVIGTTGHRKVDTTRVLKERIRGTIDCIRQMVSSKSSTPLVLSVLSPLAEGADRLITREVLNVPGTILDVVLPMEKDNYVQDFETSQSRMEFEELLSQARHVRQLPPKSNRPAAYKQVGCYIVDNCDVLIALWDGKQSTGEGGTGDIVQYARKSNCPLFWIHTENERQVTVEPGRDLNAKTFQDIDECNSELRDRS